MKNENNMLTRTELLELVEMVNVNKDNHNRVNQCQAWFKDTIINKAPSKVLRSYNTNVVVFNINNDTLYVFDYYSNTTYQHIYKFAKIVNASRITFLYQRSDNIIEMAIYKYANTYKLSNEQFKRTLKDDFKCYIGSFN